VVPASSTPQITPLTVMECIGGRVLNVGPPLAAIGALVGCSGVDEHRNSFRALRNNAITAFLPFNSLLPAGEVQLANFCQVFHTCS
jgi:hypothetical protein